MRASFVMSGVATGMRRNLSMTIALVLNTAIALTFAGGAILVSMFIGRFEHNFADKLNVSLYLCGKAPYSNAACTHELTSSEQRNLQSKLDSDPRITSVTFLSYQDSYELAKKTLTPAESEFLEEGDIPPTFVIKLKNNKTDYQPVFNEYSKLAGVDKVQDQSEELKTLLTIFDKARLGAIIAAATIMVCALLLMANAIQVAANQRRNETGIMRLVGASRWMTQLPFMIEAVIAALVGGAIAIGLDYLGKVLILDGIFKRQTDAGVFPALSANDVLIAGGAGAIGGIVLAALTAYITLRTLVRL